MCFLQSIIVCFFIFAFNSLTDWLNIPIQAERDSHYGSDYFDYEASPAEARRFGYDSRNYVYSRDER